MYNKVIPQAVVYPQLATPVVYTTAQYPVQYVQPLQSLPKKEKSRNIYDLKEKFPQGITLTWTVDAYVEKKLNIIQKLKKLCGKKDQDTELVIDPRLTPYQNYYYQQQYQQKVKDENSNIKQILTNVNGIVRPGQLCAIMGASGAGKTTLLNILNFRNRGNLIIEDDIRVNGKKVKSNEIPEYSGYVQQLDLFIGTLTVKEQLILYAMLKMDRHYTEEEKRNRVDELIHHLNLYKCQNTRIGMGDLAKGISGGEKRRLAFASEILNNPPLLFADEPTSGLDTFMAMTIVDILVKLKSENKTIICTIHQPSSQIFEKFDTLCLLSQGRVAFMGPREEAYNFFSRLGYRCPSTYNPADYYIQLLAIKPKQREYDIEKSKKICDSYDRSEYRQRIASGMNIVKSQNLNSLENEIERPWYNASYFTQTKWLFYRETLNVLRNPIATYILLGQTIFIAVFLGLVFLQLKLNEIGVQNYTGVLFLLIMQVNFGYIFAVVNSLPLELPVLYREVKNRTYSVYIYYLSKQIAEIPKFVISPFILITIVFWMSGISNDVGVFFIVSAILILTTQVAISFGMFLSVAAPNLDIALALSIPILIPLLIFAGYFLNNDSTPNFLIWIKYISWFYYANDAVSIEFWKSVSSIPCSQGSILANVTTPATTLASSSNSPATCPPANCFIDGMDVLDNYLNIDTSQTGLDIGILFALLFAYRLGAMIILKLKTMAR